MATSQAGPWSKYASGASGGNSSSGPWAKFASPTAANPPNPINTASNSTAQTLAPLKLPAQRGFNTSGVGMAGAEGVFLPPSAAQPTPIPWDDNDRTMNSNGVDITTGAPYGLRNRLSLLSSPSDSQTEQVINKYFGRDVQPTRNQYGYMEYTDPTSGRRTLVDSRIVGGGSVAPTVGGAADVVGQTAGAVAGGIGGGAVGGPVGSAVGAGVGAAGGQSLVDLGKNIVSKLLGQPTNSGGQVAMDAATAGVTTLAGGAVGLAPSGYRMLTKGFLPKFLVNVDKSGTLLAAAQKAQQALNDFYHFEGSTATSAAIKPSVPELTGDASAQQSLSSAYGTYNAANQSFNRGTPLINLEQERQQNNVDELSRQFAQASAPFQTGKPVGQSSADIVGTLQQKKQAFEAQQYLAQRESQNQAISAVGSLPSMTPQERALAISAQLNIAKNSGADEVHQAWGNLNVKLGVPPQFAMNPSDTDKYLQGGSFGQSLLGTGPTISYSKVAQAKLNGIWAEAMAFQRTVQAGEGSPLAQQIADAKFAAIPDELYSNPKHKEDGLIFGNEDFPNQVPLDTYLNGLQVMRSGLRSQFRQNMGLPPADALTELNVAHILRDNVQDYFTRNGDPTIGDALDAAEQATIKYRQNFRTGILGDIIKDGDGTTSPIFNSAVGKLLVQGNQNEGALQHFASILDGSPEAQQSVRNVIWSFYKDHYLPIDGIPTARSFAKFRSDFAAPIKAFFDSNDMDTLKTFDTMTKALAQQNNKVKNLKQAWQAMPGGAGQIPLNSTGLSKAALSDSWHPANQVGARSTGRDWQNLVNFLNTNSPDLMKQFQADTATEFARRAVTGDNVNINAMNDLVNRYGDRLNQILGPSWTNSVRAIVGAGKVLGVGQRNVQLETEGHQSIFEQLVRTFVAPPMSREGRGYTGILMARKRAAARVVYNALASPEGLADFVNKTRNEQSFGRAASYLTPLGGSILSNDNTQ